MLFVQSGVLEVVEDGKPTLAAEGEAILIPKGATVVYKGRKGTVGFFVLWPKDWNQ